MQCIPLLFVDAGTIMRFLYFSAYHSNAILIKYTTDYFIQIAAFLSLLRKSAEDAIQKSAGCVQKMGRAGCVRRRKDAGCIYRRTKSYKMLDL